MGFGRGFAGRAPDKTDGGLKRIRDIEVKSDTGDSTFTVKDISKGAINRVVSGRQRDSVFFTDVDKFALGLGISVGDDFNFKLYVDNPNRGSYTLKLPDERSASGVEYFGEVSRLDSFDGRRCVHEINFFYVATGKMAITVLSFQP